MSMISELVEELIDNADSYTKELHDLMYRAADTIEMLSEKARETKHGEWELSAFQNDADVANGNYAFICSNCEHTDIHALTQTVPYCWWCGARMKGADDEVLRQL